MKVAQWLGWLTRRRFSGGRLSRQRVTSSRWAFRAHHHACTDCPADPRIIARRGESTRWGELILPTAITEQLVTGDDGALQTAHRGGSTRPMAMTVHHGGICKVNRYVFSMP